MTSGKKIGLTFAQMLVGFCAGVLAGGFFLFWINLIQRGTKSIHLGGFLTALLILISFLIVFGAGIAGTAEGVRQMGRFIPRQASRRKIYEGAFLGICAAVAILTVTRGDWLTTLNEWGGPVKIIGTLIYFILILPLKTVTGWIPARALFLIAAPIGAAIGYNITPREEEESEEEASDDQPEDSKSRKKKK